MKKQIKTESEKDIQLAVIYYLSLLENMGKLYFFRNNSFQGSFARSNGSTGYIKNNKKGAPDIIVCFQGRYIGLEIKGTKGKQSDEQKQAEAIILMAGGEYYVIRSFDEAKKIFENT